MRIFEITCSVGEYEQDLEVFDRVVSLHQSFTGARIRAIIEAQLVFTKGFEIKSEKQDHHLMILCPSTGSYIEVNPTEVYA